MKIHLLTQLQLLNNKSFLGQVQKSHRINSDHSPRIKWETVFKSKLFEVSLEITARVISRGRILFLCWSEVNDPSWSGPTFVPT